MRGAVAAGHPLTAVAGARILEEGGNAVDACIAAGFTSWVTESPLTGPGGGGFMLVHRAQDRSDRLFDFFVALPGRGLDGAAAAPMVEVAVPFDEKTIQLFRIGGSSCAVPGVVAGLSEVHRVYGSLPWRELIAPAVELARGGVELNRQQAFLHAILDAPLRAEPDGRKAYGSSCPLVEGDQLVQRDLADTLELLAEEGAEAFYRGALGARISRAVRERGGLLTEEDLGEYRVIRRRPVRVPYAGHEFVSNAPPSSGGLLTAFALRVLDRLGSPGPPGSVESVRALAEVMREATHARRGGFLSGLYRGGLADKLLGEPTVAAAAQRARSKGSRVARERAGAPSTTHISVVDARGDAASLSASTGCGSGVIVPGTGIHLNNMLGESDLNAGDSRAGAGRRLTSMMAPSIVLAEGQPRLVVGSAGSNRLRSAILQIVVNVVAHGLGAQEAISYPRVHFEADRLNLEGGIDQAVADALEAEGYDVVRWGDMNLYFGGASTVALDGDGNLDAAGDPRRGGAGVIVD
jgi:gamma-glutamyltranspeptidase / glutathione hydrolase